MPRSSKSLTIGLPRPPERPAGSEQRQPYVGAPVRPIEARRLVAGGGRYVADVKLPGMRHVAFVRSPHAHARIRGVEASAARALAGVSDVLLGAEAVERAAPVLTRLTEIADPSGAWLAECEQPCMAVKSVRYVGEIVAAVV